MRKEVEEVIAKYLKKFFAENENEFLALHEKIMLSAKARLAAKMARETVLRKSVMSA